jgi:hypothetical protein
MGNKDTACGAVNFTGMRLLSITIVLDISAIN